MVHGYVWTRGKHFCYILDFSYDNDINFGGRISEVHLVMDNAKGCKKYPEMDMDEHCKNTAAVLNRS